MMTFKINFRVIPLITPASDPRLYDQSVDTSIWSGIPALVASKKYRFVAFRVLSVT